MIEKKVFIFSEPRVGANLRYPTRIHAGYIVMISGEEIKIGGKVVGRRLEKFYRVLDESELAGTHGPEPFMLINEFGESIQGWRFEAQEVTNPETIKALREKKIACLVLNPKCVEEVKT